MKNLLTLIFCFLLYSQDSNAIDAAVTATAQQLGTQALKGAVENATTGKIKEAGIGAVKSNLDPSLTDKIGEFFASSKGVAVMSGISTVMSGMLYKAAAQQEDDAKANVVKIERIIASFKDSFVAFCPNGRDSLEEPGCYCYLDDGTRNANRTNSKICQDAWAKNDYKITTTAGNYGGVAKFVDPVGCLNVNGAFDINCDCKKILDSKGNNACIKSSSINIPNDAFGASLIASSGVQDTMKLAAGSSNGNPNFAAFNSGLLGLKAIQAKNFIDNFRSKIPSSGKGGFMKVDEGNVLQLAKAAIGTKAMNSAMANAKSALAISNAGPIDGKSSELLKSAANKAGFDLSGGNGLQNKKGSAAKDGMNFNFGSEAASNSPVVQNFPEKDKNYNYKNSDISKSSGASLFELISNRYIQSGLKRLFEH